MSICVRCRTDRHCSAIAALSAQPEPEGKSPQTSQAHSSPAGEARTVAAAQARGQHAERGAGGDGERGGEGVEDGVEGAGESIDFEEACEVAIPHPAMPMTLAHRSMSAGTQLLQFRVCEWLCFAVRAQGLTLHVTGSDAARDGV
jgi:hypothetical protein